MATNLLINLQRVRYPSARLTTTFLKQFHFLEHHAAVDRFAHIVRAKKSGEQNNLNPYKICTIYWDRIGAEKYLSGLRSAY
jgi:hypothetical protein